MSAIHLQYGYHSPPIIIVKVVVYCMRRTSLIEVVQIKMYRLIGSDITINKQTLLVSVTEGDVILAVAEYNRKLCLFIVDEWLLRAREMRRMAVHRSVSGVVAMVVGGIRIGAKEGQEGRLR